MTSSCGRTYGFNFDFVKSPSTSTLTSPTSSLSSTISETSNSPQAIFPKKPRTFRKRPNQTYNEAATRLSTAYPNLFSTKNLKKPEKFTKPITEYNDSSELLLSLGAYDNDATSFLLENKPKFQTEPNKVFSVQEKPCQSSTRVVNYYELESEDFDCESILDEEIEEGIDSIMGSRVDDSNCRASCHGGERLSPWFDFGGKFSYVRAFQHVDDGNWWNSLVVDILEISPGMKKTPPVALVPAMEKKKKKKKVVKKPEVELSQGLLLKLNYDDVRNSWSDRGSPFADDCSGSGSPVDLFLDRGVREASVFRCKEKQNTRLCSKSIKSRKSTLINGPK